MQIINFSGPYAVGKDTIINYLLTTFPTRLHRVATLTTRPVDKNADPTYTNVSEEDFISLTSSGEYLINRQVNGRVAYATSIKEIEDTSQHGKICLHSIFAGDEGSGALRKTFGRQLLSIALVPPGNSLAEQNSVLRERLLARGRDNPQTVKMRLEQQAGILQYISENREVQTQDGSLPTFDLIQTSADLSILEKSARNIVMEVLNA